MKTESETGVKSDTPFYSRPLIKKTNSVPIKAPNGYTFEMNGYEI